MTQPSTRDRFSVLPGGQRASLVAVHAAAAAAAVLAWVAGQPTQQWGSALDTGAWLGLTTLACLGALAALDVVSALSARDVTSESRGVEIDITDVFFVAAFLLLPLPLVALVSAPAFVVEQLRYRRPLYRLAANAAAFVVILVISGAVFRVVAGPAAEAPPAGRWLVAAAAATAVHVVASAAWLLYARWVMRRVRPSLQLLRTSYPLANELSTKCVGVLLAALWLVEPVLSVLAVAPVLVVHRLLYFRHVEAEARRDGKTGLYHAGWFRDVGGRYVERALRLRTPLALVLVDLDHLRDLNNTYGHVFGDTVIEGVAELLRTSVRDGDLACRFGGEEFAVLLPGADGQVGMLVAERIRSGLAATVFPTGDGRTVRVTCSAGVALVDETTATLSDLVRAADAALYAAKSSGRNRSVAA